MTEPQSPFSTERNLHEPASSGEAAERPNTVRALLRAVAIGLVTGLVASLVVPLWAALVVAGVVVAGLYVPWVRGVATAGGVVSVAAGCISVVYGQHVHRYLPGSNWPSSFTGAGDLIWLGVVLLLADAVISAFRLRMPRALGSRVPAGGPPCAEPHPKRGHRIRWRGDDPRRGSPPGERPRGGRHRGGRHRGRTSRQNDATEPEGPSPDEPTGDDAEPQRPDGEGEPDEPLGLEAEAESSNAARVQSADTTEAHSAETSEEPSEMDTDAGEQDTDAVPPEQLQ